MGIFLQHLSLNVLKMWSAPMTKPASITNAEVPARRIQTYVDKTPNVGSNYTDLCAHAGMVSQEMLKVLALKVRQFLFYSVIYDCNNRCLV